MLIFKIRANCLFDTLRVGVKYLAISVVIFLIIQTVLSSQQKQIKDVVQPESLVNACKKIQSICRHALVTE